MKFLPLFGVLLSSLLLFAPAPADELHAMRLAAPADELGLATLVRQTLAEQRHHLSPEAVDSILIEVRTGIVWLRGEVPRSSDRVLICSLTRSVDGVRAVMDELTVTSDDPFPR